MAASVAASSTEVKAIRAAVFSNQDGVSFTYMPRSHGSSQRMQRCPHGYRVALAKLGYQSWHAVIVSKNPAFLPVVSEEGVWAYLSAETTTPICREWMPWLMTELTERKHLRSIPSSGFINAGRIIISDEALDAIVALGLRHGDIKIQA